VFQGASQLTLDGRGACRSRAGTATWLTAQCEGRLTLTRHPDGCLLVYPRPVWEARREKIATLPYSARALQRLLLGSAAADTEIDRAGRVLVALRAARRGGTGARRDVAGHGHPFRAVGPGAAGVRHEQSQLGQALPESAASFSF